MQGIDPSSSSLIASQSLRQQGPANAGAAGGNPANSAGGAVDTAGSSSLMLAHSSTTVTFVSQQVNMMLANIGQGLENQQTLRMLIALLILQELLGEGRNGDNGSGSDNGVLELLGMFNGNGGGNGNRNSWSMAALSSQTTTMQVHHEQTLAYASQSFEGTQNTGRGSYAEAAGANEARTEPTGMDLTA